MPGPAALMPASALATEEDDMQQAQTQEAQSRPAATLRVVRPRTAFAIRPLNPSHIPAMVALQDAHGEGQIINRDAHALRAHFNAGHQALGVFHKGRLVAQSLIKTECPAPRDTLVSHFNKVSTMGGVVVAPEARGQGLLDRMIGLWQQQSRAQGVDVLHARVRPENERSWMVFMRNGLSITAQGPSPEGPDHDVYFMHQPLSAAFATADEHADADDIKPLLADGFIATGWNPQRRRFVVARAVAP